MRVLVLCGLLLCTVFSVFGKETISIVRGNGDYFPKEYVESGQLTGLHYDMVQAVAKELDINVTFESLPWKRAMAELKLGHYDAMTYLSRTSERDEFAWFVKGNIISSSQVFPVILVERKNEIEFDGSIESLRPYMIAVGDGYKYGEPFDSATGLLKYVLPPPDQHTLTGLLRRHRVDVIISSRRNLLKILTPEQLDSEFHIFSQPVATDNSYLAFSKARDTYKLAQQFAKKIGQFKTTKAYLDLVAHYQDLEKSRQFSP